MNAPAQRVRPIVAYADRLQKAAGIGHHVASPLGAWLVLALAATAARGRTRTELTEVLGTDIDTAATAARELIADPHPAVGAAAATWRRAGFETQRLLDWERALPESVERGPVPDQAGADAWARRHTYGLIERFPIAMKPSTVLVLASALATRVAWVQPFDIAPGSDLAPSGWATRLAWVLRTPASGHAAYIARTARAGDVAVHTAHSPDGLAVTSVIASDDVAAQDVLAAAHEVALADAPARVSLFDLALGDAPLWTITEKQAQLTRPREERCTAILPAWHASSDYDLLSDPSLGFGAAGRALISLLPPGDYSTEARQAAMARYSRLGFEAAAVTAIAVELSAPAAPRPGVLRTATLRFGHPYAVVATCTGGGAWHGLPVFSAWVAEPSSAQDDPYPSVQSANSVEEEGS